MPQLDWHDQNMGRAYPFIADPVVAGGAFPKRALTDFGLYAAADPGDVTLSQVTVASGMLTLRFDVNGDSLDFALTISDEGTSVLASSGAGEGFVTAGNLSDLLALADGVYAVTEGALEPATVVYEESFKVLELNLAEDYAPLAGTAVFSAPLESHVVATGLTGDIRLVPGYNAAIRHRGNQIELRAAPGLGEGKPCSFDFGRGGVQRDVPACGDLIYTVNGVPAGADSILRMSTGRGIQLRGGEGWLRIIAGGTSVFDGCA